MNEGQQTGLSYSFSLTYSTISVLYTVPGAHRIIALPECLIRFEQKIAVCAGGGCGTRDTCAERELGPEPEVSEDRADERAAADLALQSEALLQTFRRRNSAH